VFYCPVLAVSAYIPATFRSVYFVHFAKLIHFDSLHSNSPSFYAFTSAPSGFGKYSFPFRKLHTFRFPQALLQRIFKGIYSFLRRVYPLNRKILREYGKSIIFTDKK